MSVLTLLLGGTRGFFFLSNHPWVAVVLIAGVIALVYFQGRKNR